MSLDYLTSKNEKVANRIVVHALGGVGKSTYGVHAAKAKSGMFILGEEGLDKLPEADGVPRVAPDVWDYSTDQVDRDMELSQGVKSFKAILKDLMVEEHDRKCLVIDTIDAFIPKLDAWVVKNNYGGDFKKADAYKSKYNDYVREINSVLLAFNYLAKKKQMEIIILAHSVVSNHKDPSSEAWKRWEINLPGGDKTSLGALVYDWADAVLYAAYDVQGENKSKERVVYTEWNPVYDAKNRFGLPEKIEFDFKKIDKLLGGKK